MVVILFVLGFTFSTSIFPLAFSLLAFTLFNWSPASVFMGDSGSTFLGGLFVCLLLQQNTFYDSFSLLLLTTPLLADSFFCLVRRLFARQSIFTPHRLHLYQRLHQAGWSHSKVSTLYILTVLMLSLCRTFLPFSSLLVTVAFVLFLGFFLDQYVAESFTVWSIPYDYW